MNEINPLVFVRPAFAKTLLRVGEPLPAKITTFDPQPDLAGLSLMGRP